MKLSTAVDRFLTDCRLRGLARETLQAYESDLRLLVSLATVHDADSVLCFTADLVRTYFKTLSAKGLQMSTLSRRRASINEFSRWGVRQRYWERSPVDELPRIKKPPRPLPRPFTEEERDRLFALDLPHDERLMRALLYFAGLRVSEVCGLRLGDITLGSLDEPGSVRPRGKGSKERLVPLAPGLYSTLRDYMLARSSLDPRRFLLTQKAGTPWRRKALERRTARWGQAAQVHDCTPHRFRHTFATDLLRQGTDIRYIQALLGHARLDTTEVYTQVANPELAKAVRRLRITGPHSGPPPSVDNSGAPKALETKKSAREGL